MEAEHRGTIGAAAIVAVALGLAAACAPSAPHARIVEIRGFAYLPDTLEIAMGDTVMWINRDVVPHSATRDSLRWDSGSLDPEQGWRLVGTHRGSQPYYCAFHPNMRGVLVVR